MLLATIRREWGDEKTFDTFVRVNLLEVLKESKGEYYGQLATIASQSFELLFGD